MSKVICDVCGTAFPETAAQCPICGCAKTPTAQPTTGEYEPQSGEGTTAYQYVKGGRFSKGNVRRNAAPTRTTERRRPDNRRDQEEPQESNKGLIAVVVVLLLAIIMVVVYIGVSVFLGGTPDTPDTEGTSLTTVPSNESTTPTGGQTVACTEVKLNSAMVELGDNSQYLLEARLTPENTTDVLTFVSADPTIAEVTENGLIRPVGYGQTVITVTCGNVSAQCTVISTVGEPVPTDSPTEPQPTAPAGFVLKLNTYKNSGEITLSAYGSSHRLYTEIAGVKASDITWTVDDPAIATVENGIVVGMDRGVTTVTASYGGKTATCLVRCSFDAPEDTTPAPYKISSTDVTISKGETFNLTLKTADGANVQGVVWTASVEGAVTINGNKITGGTVASLTKVIVSTELDGFTYSCVVYVKAG